MEVYTEKRHFAEIGNAIPAGQCYYKKEAGLEIAPGGFINRTRTEKYAILVVAKTLTVLSKIAVLVRNYSKE